LPLRQELVELIEHDSTLLEVGCGTGALLFQVAGKISSGHGVDLNQGMIKYAESKRQKQACSLLKMMVETSEMALIADFTEAQSTLGRLSIEFDELLSGHYRNYRQYRRNGEIPSYASKIGASVHKEITSVVEGISIWLVSNNSMVK